MRRRGADLVELSHAIHAEPELAFAEHRSCAKAQALVAERGFEITAAAGGLDTAFRADFGSGQLTIGVCAEYDALPEIGHACGHNIIAASAVGTALALVEVADDLGLRVALVGTPAEEAGGGKALLLKAGVFDDISAAVMLHPGPADIAAARSLALSEAIVRYRGKESHSRPTWASTPSTPSPSRKWPSGCCVSNWRRANWCTASSPTAGRRSTSSPGTRRCSTRCAPSNPTRCASWRAGCMPASPRAQWPPAANTRSTTPRPPTTNSSRTRGWPTSFARRCAGWAGSRWPRSTKPRCRWAAPTWAT